MGEARRRKKLDPNWGKQDKPRKRLDSRQSFPLNPAKNLVEYVKDCTFLKGRGYLAYAEDKCFYYGREDFIGDEDEVLKEYVKNYHPDTEVVFVWQVMKDSALFNTTILPLESLLAIEQEWKR